MTICQQLTPTAFCLLLGHHLCQSATYRLVACYMVMLATQVTMQLSRVSAVQLLSQLTEFSDLASGNSSTQHAIKISTECDDFPGSQLLFIQMLCRSCTCSQQVSQEPWRVQCQSGLVLLAASLTHRKDQHRYGCWQLSRSAELHQD